MELVAVAILMNKIHQPPVGVFAIRFKTDCDTDAALEKGLAGGVHVP